MAMNPNTIMSSNLRDEIVAIGMGKLRSLWKADKAEEDEHLCPICQEKLEQGPMGFLNVIITPCGHPFHPRCLRRFMTQPGDHPCPLCRVRLVDADMEIPPDDHDPNEHNNFQNFRNN